MNNFKTKYQELEEEVSFLKEPPFFHACGSLSDLQSFPSETISYDSLLYSSTNVNALTFPPGSSAPLSQEHILYCHLESEC